MSLFLCIGIVCGSRNEKQILLTITNVWMTYSSATGQVCHPLVSCGPSGDPACLVPVVRAAVPHVARSAHCATLGPQT